MRRGTMVEIASFLHTPEQNQHGHHKNQDPMGACKAKDPAQQQEHKPQQDPCEQGPEDGQTDSSRLGVPSHRSASTRRRPSRQGLDDRVLSAWRNPTAAGRAKAMRILHIAPDAAMRTPRGKRLLGEPVESACGASRRYAIVFEDRTAHLALVSHKCSAEQVTSRYRRRPAPSNRRQTPIPADTREHRPDLLASAEAGRNAGSWVRKEHRRHGKTTNKGPRSRHTT